MTNHLQWRTAGIPDGVGIPDGAGAEGIPDGTVSAEGRPGPG